MSEFLHNLSIQALSRSNDAIRQEVTAINRLSKKITRLLYNKLNDYAREQINLPGSSEQPAAIEVGDKQTNDKKIENAL